MQRKDIRNSFVIFGLAMMVLLVSSLFGVVSANQKAFLVANVSGGNPGQNVTTHEGDLVLENDDVFLVKDARFELKGNLLMKDNSTLILDNATFVPVYDYQWQYTYTMHGNAKLILRRNSKFVSGLFSFKIYDNSMINVTDSELEKSVKAEPRSTIHALNSELRVVELIADVKGSSSLSMINSTAGSVTCSGAIARIVDSHVEGITVYGNVIACSLYLMNSTYGNLDKDWLGKGVIYVGWHLTVSVETEGQPIEGANVEVYYLHNGSLAAQKVTQSNGKAQFDLIEWEITELGSQYVGDYKVRVSYDTTQTEEIVTMSSSKQIVIPESSDEDNPIPTTEPFPIAWVVAAIAVTAISISAFLIYFAKVKKTTEKTE